MATLALLFVLTGCIREVTTEWLLRETPQAESQAYDTAHTTQLMAVVAPYLHLNDGSTLSFDVQGAEAAGLSEEVISFAKAAVVGYNAAIASKQKAAVQSEAYTYPGGWVYVSPGDPGYGYIIYVRAVPDGLVLLLTWDGLQKGLSSSGSQELANWTAQLYRQSPSPERTYNDIGFLADPLSREINYHCIAYVYWNSYWSWVREHANPVNVRFSDYWSGATWWAWWID